ncbi:MAG: hypothetical protein LBU17_04890 [Treponema sp.]|nr:hypothetical protein [Treponema sp.]
MKKSMVFGIVALLLSGITVLFAGPKRDNADDSKVIKFAACNLKAYEDTTKVLAEEVAKLGYKLEYTFLADNTQLNEAVERGEYFANYHQHTPYMQEFNRGHNAHLAAAFKVFLDQAGIYSKKYKSIDALPQGARIVLPSDAGNNWRGLVILDDRATVYTHH